MIRQTIGFNWRPSGVSIPLQDLLLAVGITETDIAGSWVGLEPVKDEQCGELVKYGVFVQLARAMQSTCCV